MRLNPWRLSKNCKKDKDHYVRKLEQSGSRNCWGLGIDYKAMYCAFYGGIERYQSGNGTGACDSEECCIKSRIEARTALRPFMEGQQFGKPRLGMLEGLLPKEQQNLVPEVRLGAGPATVEIHVPERLPGQAVNVTTSDGQVLEVDMPEGARVGDVLTIRYVPKSFFTQSFTSATSLLARGSVHRHNYAFSH